jgi:hypothetical protein
MVQLEQSFLAALRDQVFGNSTPWSVLLTVLAIAITYQLGTLVYNIFFHPLRHFPGPKLCAASRIPLAYHMIIGDSHLWDLDLHKKYGSVVRPAPNNLSYTDDRAWKDIHGFKVGLLFLYIIDLLPISIETSAI